MQLEKLFQLQKGLDSHIEEKHGLQGEDLFDKKVLALLVEIGELANETRCFKFWSVRSSSSKDVILEEFVDGIHFILSIGIVCGFDQQPITLQVDESDLSETEQFLRIYEIVSIFQHSKLWTDYIQLFETYLQLASKLGFKNNDIETAYFKKNEVNYQRQKNNY
ncbi:dUTP diphosphatase [Neobacillus jeddahensis]|uniref:dUTP diphosphatase n=1 Tax=Neobacillus jeddahensis TaxID=1461580 RepID=UPI000590AF73|nr:dUTP diphosphatase [Neobacillus jeddahensis]